VQIALANGVLASFTMHSSSHREARETRIDGSRGSLVAGFYVGEQHATVTDPKSGHARALALEHEAGAHDGSDRRLVHAFLAGLCGERAPMTTAAESLWSHRMAFAADRAAREGSVVRW